MKRGIAALLAALCLFLTACGPKDYGPPPDITGVWGMLPDEANWYFIARVTEDTIKVMWYQPIEKMAYLYWEGTFTPPEDGKEPYSWESTTLHTVEELESSKLYNRATREQTKTFTYEDDKITFLVTSGYLRMAYTVERRSDYSELVVSEITE